VKSFLKIHPVWLPLAGVAGLVELIRQRRRPAVQGFIIITALTLAWAVFRLWTYVMTQSYVWDATLMLGAAGAVGLERLLIQYRSRRLGGFGPVRGLTNQAIARICTVFIVFCAFVFGVMVLRQRPYVPASLRAFAVDVQRQTGDGRILFDDRRPGIEEYTLLTFRLAIVTERIVPASWLSSAVGQVTPFSLQRARIRYFLGRTDNLAIAVGEPLAADPATGWKLWRTR
jgi:hypothetical protein